MIETHLYESGGKKPYISVQNKKRLLMDLSLWLLGAVNYFKSPKSLGFFTAESMFFTLSSSFAGRTWSPVDTQLTEKNEGLWNHRIRNGCQISPDKQIPPTLTARKTNTRNGDRWESVGRGGVLDHTKQQNGLCSLEAIRPRGPQLLPAAHVCLLCSQMSLPPLPLLLQCDEPNSKWERMAAWRVCLNEIWFALHGSHSLAHSNTAWLC